MPDRGGAAQAGDAYVRGAGSVHIDGRRLARILVGLAAAALVALAVVFAVIAVDDNARVTLLKQHGVPVGVTVTGCVGIASGTGVTEAGYTCTGSFTLSGRSYRTAIGGSSQLLAVGRHVAAVAVRDKPSTLYTASSVAKMHSSWKAYLTPGILLLGALAMEAFRRLLRGSRPPARSPSLGPPALPAR